MKAFKIIDVSCDEAESFLGLSIFHRRQVGGLFVFHRLLSGIAPPRCVSKPKLSVTETALHGMVMQHQATEVQFISKEGKISWLRNKI